jgi:DeoR/GlpR family transcriptional regulator of sugar metabolism
LLASDRRREIFNRLVREGYVEAKELAEELGVDASTIRRDLDALARSGQVKRTHGGARTVPGVSADLPYSMKETARLDQKAAIAGVAVQRVRDGDTVVLDSGSTTYEIAVRLRNHEDLTVITNDLRIATFIADLRRFRLLVAGGELLGSVYTLTGRRTVEFLLDYAADWTFLGADAVDAAAGITNTNTLEIPVKRAMLEVAATTVVVADSSKFGHRALAKVADLDEVDEIITDSDLPSDSVDVFGKNLITVADPAPTPG